ncbi:ABC transporter substrate-binding protein [Microbacterium thalassium]|uniref:ABC-type branched-subunit amino acid transport system substrate-binding protein n=1 Tax=Microbacterium thalassium TaxID=362649 RepID=A0A7X0KW97_9MICO|nr:ABC transporter substrate-binding protein [Microbacterium thalassium]MBB6393047.1 ABC-type branched-subunit amino acid transport system substrate-binding protein [Microbacterium thalassium]GLK22722.1 branched-chain amino acid ABC transporter substrate-binding protein [Microbacterium thalassium]
MNKRIIAGVAAAAAASLLLAGCSSDNGGGDNGGGGDGVATDYGVTDTTITLGVLTDVSNIYTATAVPMVSGTQIYADEVNAAGGLCGRDLEIDVQDHGSDSATATQLFQGMQDEVLGFGMILGSPQQDALKDFIANAEITAVVAGWSTTALENPYYVLAGTTYPTEVINGLSWLEEQGMIAPGDTIGYINVPGPFGGDARAGGEYFADENGYTLTGVEITGKETDLAAQVDQLKAAGVTAVFMSTGPGSYNQAATAMKAAGLDVPLMTNTPGYAPFQIAPGAPAGDFILENGYVTTSMMPFGNPDSAKAVEVAAAFDADYAADNNNADANVNFGYGAMAIFGAAIEAACDAGDLTRAGIQAALATLTSVDTGVLVPLDYSDPEKTPSMETYILRPSDTEAGSSVLEATFGPSATAEAFNE